MKYHHDAVGNCEHRERAQERNRPSFQCPHAKQSSWFHPLLLHKKVKEASPMVIPYVAGVGEDIWPVWRDFNLIVTFWSGKPLHSESRMCYVLVNLLVWYTISLAVVARSTSERPSEGWRQGWRGIRMLTSEGWQRWQDTRGGMITPFVKKVYMSVRDYGSGVQELSLKEALYIIPVDKCINKDGGLAIPSCCLQWKRGSRGSNPHWPVL